MMADINLRTGKPKNYDECGIKPRDFVLLIDNRLLNI